MRVRIKKKFLKVLSRRKRFVR